MPQQPNPPLSPTAIGFLSILFLSPLVYWYGLRDPSALPRYAFFGIGIGILFILWLFDRRHAATFFWHPVMLPVAALFIWSSASLSWSVDPYNSVVQIIQLAAFVLFFALTIQLGSRELIHKLTLLLPISAAVAALIGIGHYYDINPLGVRQAAIPASTFVNKNIAAAFFELVLPLSIIATLIQFSNKRALFYSLCTSLILGFITISHTRGSYLAIGLGMIIVAGYLAWNKELGKLFRQKIAEKKAVVPVIFLFPLLLLLVAPSSNQGPAYQDRPLIDKSASTRLNAYLNATMLIKDHPVRGVGIGGFRLGFRPYMSAPKPLTALTEEIVLARLHNDPLQQFTELGIPGGLLSIAIVVTVFILGLQALRRTTESVSQFMLLGIITALLISGMHSFLDFPLRKPSSALLFWVYMGLISAVYIKQFRPRNLSIIPLATLLIAAFALLFSVINTAFYKNAFAGSKLLNIAQTRFLESLDNCSEAKTAIDDSMNIYPFSFSTHIIYAQIYTYCDIPQDEKFASMEKILNYDPSNVRARLTRGDIYLARKEYEKAEQDYTTATILLPHRASGYIGLGHIARHHGDMEKAAYYYQRAESLEPDHPVLRKLKSIYNQPPENE